MVRNPFFSKYHNYIHVVPNKIYCAFSHSNLNPSNPILKSYTVTMASKTPAAKMSPLDTLKVDSSSVHEIAEHPILPLHVHLHQRTQQSAVAIIHNTNTSWLSTQNWLQTALPAYDNDCAMFAKSGDVALLRDLSYNVDFTDKETLFNKTKNLTSNAKIAVLPNRAVAVFGDNLNQLVSLCSFFLFFLFVLFFLFFLFVLLFVLCFLFFLFVLLFFCSSFWGGACCDCLIHS